MELQVLLYTYFNGFIAPSDVYWTMSGAVLNYGSYWWGWNHPWSCFGAALIVTLETIVSSYTDLWMLIVGVVFIIFVIFFPKGIVGIGQSILPQVLKTKHQNKAYKSPFKEKILVRLKEKM